MTKVMTVGEVAVYLHIGRPTVYKLLRNRELPAFRIGSDWRFAVEAIDRWRLERQHARRAKGRAEPSASLT
jgi:excisionase family DNA binding protein